MHIEKLQFSRELKEEFGDDCMQHLIAIEALIIHGAKNFSSNEMIALKRHLHCLKGSAQAIGETSFSEALHALETKLENCIAEGRMSDFIPFLKKCIVSMKQYAEGYCENDSGAQVEAFFKTVIEFN